MVPDFVQGDSCNKQYMINKVNEIYPYEVAKKRVGRPCRSRPMLCALVLVYIISPPSYSVDINIIQFFLLLCIHFKQ
jgi:hypothetical protein